MGFDDWIASMDSATQSKPELREFVRKIAKMGWDAGVRYEKSRIGKILLGEAQALAKRTADTT